MRASACFPCVKKVCITHEVVVEVVLEVLERERVLEDVTGESVSARQRSCRASLTCQ